MRFTPLSDLSVGRVPNQQTLAQIGQTQVGWKKVFGSFILELRILQNSPRVSIVGSKGCRAQKVQVVRAFDRNGDEISGSGARFQSLYDHSFVYDLGGKAEAASFEPDCQNQSGPGIYFFVKREEAENW